MGATVGRAADPLSFYAALRSEPYRFDFYQTLRRLECLHAARPRWGQARRPSDEPVRLGQDADLSFAPAPLASFEPGAEGRPPRLLVRLFGLLGPNGPLPIHLTEYARERQRNAGDPTLARFLDLFHHRFLALFYRAWAQAQPHVQHDRPRDDRFSSYIGSFVGIAPSTMRGRDAVSDLAKLFHSGTLARHVRNADGLRAILEEFFRVPVRIQEFVGHWMTLDRRDRTRAGREGATLGAGAVLGGRVWDRQHKFRIHIGPLSLAAYERFLPSASGGRARPLDQLVAWVRLYLSFELDWDVRLRLARDETPAIRLGRYGRLGWTTWLDPRRLTHDPEDLRLNAEAFARAL